MHLTLPILAYAAAGWLFSATPAEAHIVSSRLGDFYAGMLHPLTALPDLILWLALGVLAACQRPVVARWLVVLFPIGVLAGLLFGVWLGWSTEPAILDAGLMVCLGGLIAAAVRLPSALFLACAVSVAAYRGITNASGVTPGSDLVLFASGAAVASYTVITLVMAGVLAFRRSGAGWQGTAIRAGGSWIAADRLDGRWLCADRPLNRVTLKFNAHAVHPPGAGCYVANVVVGHPASAKRPAAMIVRLLLPTLLLLSSPALAHVETGVSGGLASGFLHPLTGLDHLVAMVAVGLWGAQLGRPAIWLLPICFPVVMAIGGLAGILGLPLPATELVIAASALVLGFAVAMAVRVPFTAAAAVVSVFAVFHGYAHGREMPGAANALAYGVGFVAATGLLHAAGIAMGLMTRWPVGARTVRALGAGIAGLGAVFLLSLAA